MKPKGPGCALILGGARSGKSAFAEEMVVQSGLSPVYLATGRSLDAEMETRICQHKERRGSAWTTVEEPLELVALLTRTAAQDRAVLTDCLTLWVTNLMLENRDVRADCDALADCVASLPGLLVFVSNEVGLGIVPDNAMAREFRDHAGYLHQKMAARSDEVTFIAAGLPMKLKG